MTSKATRSPAKTKAKTSTRGKGVASAASPSPPELITSTAESLPNIIPYRGFTLHRLDDLIDGGRAIQRWEIHNATGKACGVRAGDRGAKFAVDLMLDNTQSEQVRTIACNANRWDDL